MNGTNAVVLDASVVVKLLIEEAHSLEADALLRNYSHPGRVIYVPPHFHAEVANVIYRRRLRSDPALRISDDEARFALTKHMALPLEAVEPPDLYADALDFAIAAGLRSIYDSIYVTLARQLSCELWTADQALIASCGASAPWVRYIGDYQPAR